MLISSLVAFFVLGTGLVVSSAQPPNDGLQPLPNIGYLGSGYDILKGNPLALGTVDPGFQVYSSFDLSAAGYHPSPDQRYLVPNGTELRLAPACEVSFEASSIDSISAYEQKLRQSVKTTAGYMLFSFSASQEYQKVTQRTQEDLAMYAVSEASCQVYSAFLDIYTPPPLSQNFLAAVEFLPTEWNNDNAAYYHRFLEQFGTHYAVALQLGAKFGQQSRFTWTGYSSYIRTGQKFVDGAQLSGFGAGVSFSKMSSDDQARAKAFMSAAAEQEEFTVGSRPPSSGQRSDWVSSATLSPMPLAYTLADITDLLTTQYFPTHHNISAIAQNTATARKTYCQYLQTRGMNITCSPAPPPPSRDDPYIAALSTGCNALASSWVDNCGCGNGPYCYWSNLRGYLGGVAFELAGCPFVQSLKPHSEGAKAFYFQACESLDFSNYYMACVSKNCDYGGSAQPCLSRTARQYLKCPNTASFQADVSNTIGKKQIPIPLEGN